MATRMQQRRGTSTDWTTANPVLAAGELGFESDSGYFKIGDGVNQWADLPYFESADVFTASLADYIELAEKGAANGVAELDANGNVPINQLGNIIDGAPGVLDTLNELAAALNDDADFFTTITTSISSGDSTTLASAQAYTDNALANFTTLPDQTGNSGEYLTTDGTTASWAPLTLDKAVGDLTDVTLTTPADGDALVYDANTATWVNGVVDVAGAIATANEYTDNAIAAIPPTDLTGYATESYVGTAISNLVDSAPATLDTLNELAAALGDDANFATTVTNSIATKADKLVSFSSKTGASSTLALTDADKMLEISTTGGAHQITVPTDASVAFPVGTTINLTQIAGGTVTVVGASGVTLNYTPSNTLRTQWSSAVLVKRAANTWLLSGDLL